VLRGSRLRAKIFAVGFAFGAVTGIPLEVWLIASGDR
jgi:hypothetical protein